MALAHGRALLADARTTTVVGADVRQPEELLAELRERKLIDFDQPVGLLLLAILHHLHDDDDPTAVARRLIDALPSGSYLAISHFYDPGAAQPELSEKARAVEKVFNETLGTGRWRTRDEIRASSATWSCSRPGWSRWPSGTRTAKRTPGRPRPTTPSSAGWPARPEPPRALPPAGPGSGRCRPARVVAGAHRCRCPSMPQTRRGRRPGPRGADSPAAGASGVSNRCSSQPAPRPGWRRRPPARARCPRAARRAGGRGPARTRPGGP